MIGLPFHLNSINMFLEIKRQDRYSRGELLLRTFFGALYIGIPHIFVMYFVMIYVAIMNFIAFWVILFTGKFPRSTFDLLLKFQSWAIRLGASFSNLIEGYPEIGLNGSHPHVTYHVTYPETVSRGSLLLKAMFGIFYVLLPHAFVLMFRQIAGAVLGAIAWWAVLITGEYPESWFKFQVGTIIWQQRINTYMSSMEDDYPPFSGKSDQELGRDQSTMVQ